MYDEQIPVFLLFSSAFLGMGWGKGAEGLRFFDPSSGLCGKFLFQSHNNISSILQQHMSCSRRWVEPVPEYRFYHIAFTSEISSLPHYQSVLLVMGNYFSPQKKKAVAIKYNSTGYRKQTQSNLY